MKPRRLQPIAKVVDRLLNPRRKPGERRDNGFVLITFRQGGVDKPRCISTLTNDELGRMLKICIAELEGRIGKSGHA